MIFVHRQDARTSSESRLSAGNDWIPSDCRIVII